MQCILLSTILFFIFRILNANSIEFDSDEKSSVMEKENTSLSTSCQQQQLLLEEDSAHTCSNEKENMSNPHQIDQECSMYLAESSIPNAGFGIYTTKFIPRGSYTGSPSLSIVTTDMYYHYGERDPDWAQANYNWEGNGYSTFEASETAETVMNLGTSSNYHTYLTNIDHFYLKYNDAMVDRYNDSTAGSFTYYDGHQFYASKNIEAGEELFVDYGEEWLDERADKMSQVPRSYDFHTASRIMLRLFDGWNKGRLSDIEYDTVQMIYDTTILSNKRMGAILPKDRNELLALNITSSSKPSKIRKDLALRTTNKRNVTWIREHGVCLDNLVPGPSRLPKAGRGAFASRRITQDDIIIPVPLLQIMDRSALNILNLTIGEDGYIEPVDDTVIGQQLLLNYCYGHDESSILLCPATNAALINHCSKRNDSEWNGKCNDGPNAAVRWATWDKNTQVWLNYSIDEMLEATQNDRRGISLEVYALRDIEMGEEVTIDYGVSWENDFLHHRSTWSPPPKDDYVPVSVMNEKETIYRTIEELKTNPYPHNVQLACYKLYDHNDALVPKHENDKDVLPYFEDATEEERSSFSFGYRNSDEVIKIDPEAPNQIVTPGKFQIDRRISSGSGWHWPCEVLARKDEYTYTVRILVPPISDGVRWAHNRQARIIFDYPAQSIQFVTKMNKADNFLSGAFRHAIGLADDMFPEQWKDLREGLDDEPN